MKTFGKEIWNKKMKEQGDLGVIAGVRAKRKQIDKDHFNNILELVSKYNFYKKVL